MTPYSDEELETDFRAALDVGDPEHIGALAREINQRGKAAASVPLHAAALWYGEQGLRVFPLSPGSKIPFKGSNGCHDASSNPDVINGWWESSPDANIGIATGTLIDVIDIDGPQGAIAWARLIEDLPPILGRVSTPRPGGNHLYVAAVSGRGNKAALVPGVDYRGAGGYVVAPPSVIHPGGKDAPGTYRWHRPLELEGAV